MALSAAPAWRGRLSPRHQASPYPYIAPFFLVFAAFGLFPLALYRLDLSLHQLASRVAGAQGWVGLANYTRLLSDPFFLTRCGTPWCIGVISTVPQLLMALGPGPSAELQAARARPSSAWDAAAERHLGRCGRPDLRPTLRPGLRDGQLVARRLRGAPHRLAARPRSSWTAISAIVTWRWTGYNALIYLAAMQAVPFDLYEAAAIDGASRRRQFLSVTIPRCVPPSCSRSSSPRSARCSSSGSRCSSGGGPATGGSEHQYQTLTLYMYNKGWNLGTGPASAVAWADALLIIGLVLVNAGIARRRAR